MLLLAALLVAAPDALPDVRQRIENERAAARQLAERESSLLGRLADLERQIEVEGRSLRAAQTRLRSATARLAVADARANETDARLSRAADAAAPRLVVRYRLAREGYLRFLLGASSIADVLRRKRLLDTVLERDLGTLVELRAHADAARAARDERAAARRELAESVDTETERRAEMDATLEQQRRALAGVQQERSLHEEAARELEQAEQELRGRLADLRAPQKPVVQGPSVRKARRKLLFPVEGGRIEVRFGRTTDPRFNTITLQRGIDVRAPLGAPVRAVFSGKVVHAGWFKGYGKLLIVDHGEGIFSLMAHLDTLERSVGEALQPGEQVGTVGETGSLKGAYLYFELRDGQQPLDPERWFPRMRKRPALYAGRKGAAVR